MHINKYFKRVSAVVLCLALAILFLMPWGNVPVQAYKASMDSANISLTSNNESVIPGDANGDGVIDMADIIKVERIILGLDAPTPGADANKDGEIDMGDVAKIEQIILGKN